MRSASRAPSSSASSRDAGSLQALAEDLGVSYDSVKSSVLAAVQADLDAAVAEGLSQERADQALERVTTWLDAGGEVGGLRWHDRSGRWGDQDAEEELRRSRGPNALRRPLTQAPDARAGSGAFGATAAALSRG